LNTISGWFCRPAASSSVCSGCLSDCRPVLVARAIGIPMGLAVFILYYILFTFAKMVAKDQTLPIGPAMWGPNMVILLMALFFIRQVSNETAADTGKNHQISSLST